MKPRKIFTVIALIVALSLAYYSMNTAPVVSDDSYSYHGGTQWHSNYTEAREIAAEENKPMLIYYWATWCTYCEDYNKKVYSKEDVRNKLDNFVLVAVNMDADTQQATRLRQRYNADYPPQHVAVTPEGEPLVRIGGYVERERFISLLDRAERRYSGQA